MEDGVRNGGFAPTEALVVTSFVELELLRQCPLTASLEAPEA